MAEMEISKRNEIERDTNAARTKKNNETEMRKDCQTKRNQTKALERKKAAAAYIYILYIYYTLYGHFRLFIRSFI